MDLGRASNRRRLDNEERDVTGMEFQTMSTCDIAQGNADTLQVDDQFLRIPPDEEILEGISNFLS